MLKSAQTSWFVSEPEKQLTQTCFLKIFGVEKLKDTAD